MRFVSPVALGIMLAFGAASMGVAVTPASAKEKKQDESQQGPKLKLSPEFLGPARKLSDAVTKKDVEAAKAAAPEALAAAKSNDDKFQYYSLMLNLSIAANDQAMQDDALKGMLATGLVPAAQAGQFNAIVASKALDAKDYDSALAYAQKAQALGYKPWEVYPIMAQATWSKGGNDKAAIAQGLDLFRQGIDAMKAAGQPVPAQWYQVGVSKAAAASLPQLGDWARLAYAAEPTGENLRTVLRVFQRDNPTMTNRENLDLLRLMSVSGGLKLKPDYLEYAEMAIKGGVYGEAKATIDDGRAKGVLGTGDGADYYSLAAQKIPGDKGSLGAASSDAAKAPTGKIASATADAYLGYGDYAKAANLYALALQKGGIDANEVNTRLGIADAMAGDNGAAKAAFAKVTSGMRSGIARLWMDYLEAKSSPKPAA